LALTDKLGADGNSNGISAHDFYGALAGWFVGDWTRAKAISSINNVMTKNGVAVLSSGDETELDNMLSHYDGLGSDTAKIKYYLKIEAYTYMLQTGEMTSVQWDTFMNT